MKKTKERMRESTEKAEDIVSEFLEYENVGDSIACVVEEVYSTDDERIKVDVDTPGKGSTTWTFQKPYTWSESNPFVELCENRDLTRTTFDMLVNERVLVKKSSTSYRNTKVKSDNGNWMLITDNPEDYAGEESSKDIHRKTGRDKTVRMLKYVGYASAVTIASVAIIGSAFLVWFAALTMKYIWPFLVILLFFMIFL